MHERSSQNEVVITCSSKGEPGYLGKQVTSWHLGLEHPTSKTVNSIKYSFVQHIFHNYRHFQDPFLGFCYFCFVVLPSLSFRISFTCGSTSSLFCQILHCYNTCGLTRKRENLLLRKRVEPEERMSFIIMDLAKAETEWSSEEKSYTLL